MLDALKHKILAIPFAVISCVSAMAGNPKVMTGIEVLEKHGFWEIEGRRVGLVTNPSGVDSSFAPPLTFSIMLITWNLWHCSVRNMG